MRFGFYTSLSLCAILATESRQALALDVDEADEYLLSQVNWDALDDEEFLNALAQIESENESKQEYD